MTTNIQRTVCCDFDGTICKYAFPDCGAPNKVVIETLRILRAEGWRIIIHSSRVNSQWEESERRAKTAEMIAYLIEHKVPFDEVWGEMWAVVGKPVAHVYLDDRALRPTLGDTVEDLVAECRWLAKRAEEEHEAGKDS